MLLRGRSWSGHERNCCFLNLGGSHAKEDGPRFANISALSGVDFADDGRAVAIVDWDHDGDLDVWLGNRSAPRLRFMRNEAGREAGQFLALRLTGNGTTTNRDAIGARVELVLAGDGATKRIKTVRAGDTYLSQSSKWLHFGLGPEEVTIEKVVVRWPKRGANTIETFEGLQPNGRYLLNEGGALEEWKVPVRNKIGLRPGMVAVPAPKSAIRVAPITLYQMPNIDYETYQGQSARQGTEGQWTWLNLWATWCTPCMVELQEITERAQDLKAANVHVLALSVDHLGSDQVPPSKVKDVLNGMKFPFRGGLATATLLDVCQQLDDRLSLRKEDLPVPTSILINAKNQVVAIYKGAVEVDRVLKDASRETHSYDERWERALSLGGQRIPHERVRRTSEEFEATELYRQGLAFQKAKHNTQASRCYQDALQHNPILLEARLGHGETLQELNKLEAAAVELNKVLAKDGTQARAHYALSLVALKRGHIADGITSLEKTVHHDPNHLLGLNNLAWLLATHNDPAVRDAVRAVQLAERAVSLNGERDHTFLGTLAESLVGAGRPQDALQALNKAAAILERGDNKAALKELQAKRARIARGIDGTE